MGKRLLGWDGSDHGTASWWHEDGNGGWAVETVQDTDPLLDLNKEAQNHCSPWNADRDVKMVARIPFVIMQKWQNEYGVDYWNPDHQAAVDRLLDDPDWRWLRTDGTNHNTVHVSRGGLVFDAPTAPVSHGLVKSDGATPLGVSE